MWPEPGPSRFPQVKIIGAVRPYHGHAVFRNDCSDMTLRALRKRRRRMRTRTAHEANDNARLRPPTPKFIERLVQAFAARRLGFRRQLHELLQELRVLTGEKAIGNKGLDGGHRTSARR